MNRPSSPLIRTSVALLPLSAAEPAQVSSIAAPARPARVQETASSTALLPPVAACSGAQALKVLPLLLIRRATVPHRLACPAAALACEDVAGHSMHLTGVSGLYSGLVGLVSVWIGYGGSRELKRGVFKRSAMHVVRRVSQCAVYCGSENSKEPIVRDRSVTMMRNKHSRTTHLNTAP